MRENLTMEELTEGGGEGGMACDYQMTRKQVAKDICRVNQLCNHDVLVAEVPLLPSNLAVIYIHTYIHTILYNLSLLKVLSVYLTTKYIT